MATSRSTPRLRLTAALLAVAAALVAVSERPGWDRDLALWLALVGFVLVVAAALGRIWTSAFIAGRKDRSLVTSGPYAGCRHPLYALSMLGMVGLGLATRSTLLAVSLPAAAGLLMLRAAAAEDTRLRDAHGDAYARYAARTPAFVPRPGSCDLPEVLEVHPRVFRKAFLDAASLLGVYALIRVLDALQIAGVLPTLLRLP